MKKLQCELCGSIDIKKIDEHTFECQSCGVKYSTEEVKRLLVEVSGKIQIDNNEKLSNLYTLARTELDKPSCGIAQKCYEEILMLEPTSWEAHFFSAFCVAYNSTLGELRSAPKKFSKSLENVFTLIKNNNDDEAILQSVDTVYKYSLKLCNMFINANNSEYDEEISREPYVTANSVSNAIRYKQEKNEIIFNANKNYVLNSSANLQIMQELGDTIEKVFDSNAIRFKVYMVDSWKFLVDNLRSLLNVYINDETTNTIVKNINTYIMKIKKYDSTYGETPIEVTNDNISNNNNKPNASKAVLTLLVILAIISVIIVIVLKMLGY